MAGRYSVQESRNWDSFAQIRGLKANLGPRSLKAHRGALEGFH